MTALSTIPPLLSKVLDAPAGHTYSILIVVSSPVDPDCVGSALALQWLCARQHAVEIISFAPIPQSLSRFPGIEQVRAVATGAVDVSRADLLLLVDGSSWSQFFGTDWQTVLRNVDLGRVVNLDHHQPGDICADIPKQCLRLATSSTAQVIYEQCLCPRQAEIPVAVADVLYRALLYDTRMFHNEMYPRLYAFAEALIAAGADHAAAVDVDCDPREMELLSWAIEQTEFLPDLCLSLLVIDQACGRSLSRRFGKQWPDFLSLYKEVVQRQVQGYHYGLILRETAGCRVRLNWRTRNYGEHLSVGELARSAGFDAGGHRNAGD